MKRNLKETSEVFSNQWKHWDEKKIEKEFMEAIDSIVTFSKSEDGDEDNLRNSYDAPLFYKSVADAIEKFNTLLHIVSVTKSWKEE